MSKKKVCPKCGGSMNWASASCNRCFKAESRAKKITARTCPSCGGRMNIASTTCRNCHFNKIETRQLKVCPVCQKEFYASQANLDKGYGKFCSHRCARQRRPAREKKRVQVVCFVCGTTVERHVSSLRKTKGDKNFCSTACWYEHNQRDNHYGWEGGQHERLNPEANRWRKAVRKRDGGCCRLCLSKEDLEVHHIKRFATHPEERWEVGNGMLLCGECHKQLRGVEELYQAHLARIVPVKRFILNSVEDLCEAIAQMGPDE